MRSVISLLIGVLTPALAAAQITPVQEAQVKRVLAEVVEMDEELQAIQRNQEVLKTSPAARRDEYHSLLTRYPGIAITPSSTPAEMYRALYRYRMQRAATVKPLVEEQVRHSRVRSCEALRKLQKGRADLEASDGYRRAKLQDRLELRKAFDDLIAAALADEGDPCMPTTD